MNKIEIEEFKDSKKIKNEQGKINFYSISSKNEFTKIKSDLEKILEPTYNTWVIWKPIFKLV